MGDPKVVQFSADILDEIETTLKKISPTLKATCVGGGRISHESSKKKIIIYGYSQAFGKADHEVTANILKKAYPDYNIDYNNINSPDY